MRALAPFVPVLLALALAGAVRPYWTIDPDAAAYVTLARHLSSGDGYVLDGVPHGKYPPGLPVLLAGLMRLAGPAAYDAFHAALLAALLVAVGLAGSLARRMRYPEPVPLAVMLGTGLSVTLFDLSLRYLRTEVLFSALSLGALLCTLSALRPGGRLRTPATLAAALLIVASILTRLAGVTLLAVPALHLLRPADGAAGRRRAALLLLAGLAAVAWWTGRAGSIRESHPSAPDYGLELLAAEPRDLTKTIRLDMPTLDAAGLAARVAGNLEVLARASATLLTNVDKAAARLPVGALLLAVLLAGLAAMGRRAAAAPGDEPLPPDAARARTDAALYVAATLLLYLVWPFNQQERFYAPLLPLLLLAAGEGVRLLRRVLAAVVARRGGRVLALLVACGTLALLASQRSDAPVVLGRWSRSYAALLAVAAVGLAALLLLLRRGRVPALRPAHALLLPLLFGPSWFVERFVRWPEETAALVAHGQDPQLPPHLAAIAVNPVLEEVARHLLAHAAPGSVVMSDVPKMLFLLSGVRCVPLVYRAEPPQVETGPADLLFFTHDPAVPDAGAAVAASSAGWTVEREFAPVDLGDGTRLVPRLWRVRAAP